MSQVHSMSLINKLVSFDTTSMQSNLELIEFVKNFLSDCGVRSVIVFDEDRVKANLYATVGPEETSGVMLSGHTDVVPVAGQDWNTNPFAVVERDGALFGRGTADMKSFIAVVLAHVPELAKTKLRIPIHLAFSYDEEIGCVGVRRLLDMMQDLSVRPHMCIVGEPTSMQVVNAHKGKRAQKVTVTGLAAHSSLPNIGVNAVEIAAEMVVFIRRIAIEFSTQGPHEEGFEVEHSTLHTGIINGGTALNIVPNSCSFEYEIRNIPGHDPQPIIDRIYKHAKQILEPKMREVNQECRIAFEDLSGYPGMSTSASANVVDFVKALTDTKELGKVSFGTEGGLFTDQLRIPTVVCGPGNIEQAHKPNEFISIAQIKRMDVFMERLAKALV